MTMKDVENDCRCKYAKWTSGKESATAWIECRRKGESTDPAHCAKCEERESNANIKAESIRS